MYGSICESVYYDFSGMLFSCSNTELTSAVNPDMQTLYAGGRTREDPKVQRRKIRLGKVTLWLFQDLILLNLRGGIDGRATSTFCRGRIADGTDLEFYVDTRPSGSGSVRCFDVDQLINYFDVEFMFLGFIWWIIIIDYI